MLCIMAKAKPYGHLLIRGKPATPRQIAALGWFPGTAIVPLLQELEANMVFSRNDEKVIYSRRLVEDFTTAELARHNGKKGGNPRLNPPP
jgi:hypothetical protein